MGSIGSLSSNYYQLSSLLSGGTGSGTSSSSTSEIQSLADALNAADSSNSDSSSDSSDAYLLNLSPQAQQLLGGSTTGTTDTSDSSGSSNFVLSASQQATITSILEKYKDAPFTQATFDSIQNDLQAAGLSPQKLGAQDQITSFNATDVLVQALGGNYDNLQSSVTSVSDEQTKESNYLSQIVSQWQSISTTASSSSSSTGSTTTSA